MKPVYCRGCKYTKDCNGCTQEEFGRCPEWVMSEVISKGILVKDTRKPVEWTHSK